MELLSAALGAAIGVLGTAVFNIYKSRTDRFADARVKQFESVRDAAMHIETEYRKLFQRVANARGSGAGVPGIEANIYKALLDYLTEVSFQCSRTELMVIDRSIAESLDKIQSRTILGDLQELAFNNDPRTSEQLVSEFARETMEMFRELTRDARDVAWNLEKKQPQETHPRMKFWSYEDERQKNKRRGTGMYT